MGLQVITAAGGGGTTSTFAGGLTAVDLMRTNNTWDWKTVTAHADIHTKGNYTELIASTSAAATMMRVRWAGTGSSTVDTAALLDIATGAGGAESDIISNMLVGFTSSTNIGTTTGASSWFPVDIPAGTRIAARTQSLVTLQAVTVIVELYGGGLAGAGIDTMGANTATSGGVAVTGGVAAFGTWTEIEDSTAAIYRLLTPSIQGGETGFTGFQFRLQLGTGAALSEVAVYDAIGSFASTEVMGYAFDAPVTTFTAIPAGTRLSARIAAGGSADIFEVCIHGVK